MCVSDKELQASIILKAAAATPNMKIGMVKCIILKIFILRVPRFFMWVEKRCANIPFRVCTTGVCGITSGVASY